MNDVSAVAMENFEELDDVTTMRPSTISTIIFFGSITLCWVGMVTKTWMLGDMMAFKAAASLTYSIQNYEPKERFTNLNIPPLRQYFISIYILLHHFTILGFVLALAYLMENYPFDIDESYKSDRDTFIMFLLLTIIIGYYSIQQNWNDDEVALHYNNPTTTSSSSSPSKKKSTKKNDDDEKSLANRSTISKLTTFSNGSNLSFEEINMQHEPKKRIGRSPLKSNELISILELSNDEEKDIDPILDTVTLSSATYRSSSSKSSISEKADKVIEEILLNDDEEGLRKREGSSASEASLSSSQGAEFVALEIPPCSPNFDVLNINQTLEWKGFMTICLILYQFTNPQLNEQNLKADDESNEVVDGDAYYNVSRIFITSYLFLTGFGQTMNLIERKDVSIRRLVHVIFRMNLGAIFLCLVLDKPYIYYNACTTHSYFFLIVFFTMKWKSEMNQSKYGIRIKMAILVVVIFLIWDCDLRLFPTFHAVIFGWSDQAVEGAPYGQLYEFYFRGYVHHWAPFLGMLFAINHPIVSLFLRKVEMIGNPGHALSKGFMAISLILAAATWGKSVGTMSKYAYNSFHPYFGFIIPACYTFLRNIIPTFRMHHVQVFKKIGIHSLEIYLLHHHVFLGGNTITKLMVLSGYPLCNFIVVFALLFLMAKALRASTIVITSMLVTKTNGRDYISNLLGLGGGMILLYVFSLTLQSAHMLSAGSLLTVTIVCGILLYTTCMDIFWMNKSSRRRSDDSGSSTMDETLLTKLCPPLMGTMVILLLGLGFQVASIKSSALPTQPLPAFCESIANEGMWFEGQYCTDYQRGILDRTHQVSSIYNNCDGDKLLQWGWKQNENKELSSKCVFRYKSPKEVRNKLLNRNIIFVGDRTTRQLFNAVCRSLGDESYGGFDAKAQLYTDASFQLDGTILEFKWAPLTVDILAKMKSLKARPKETVPSLIVAGGGAWDKLHVWATEEDQSSYRSTIQKLANEINTFDAAPIVWLTPTSVHTYALSSEEKRTQMSEIEMKKMRDLYDELGVTSAADFTLRGPNFTEGVRSKSNDGLHYPPFVYNVGSQILLNALDWLLPIDFSSSNLPALKKNDDRVVRPRPGSLANPLLGIMVLCFIIIGLAFFDVYFGLSYLASFFIRTNFRESQITLLYTSLVEQKKYSINPLDLYKEIDGIKSGKKQKEPASSSSIRTPSSGRKQNERINIDRSVDQEEDSLLMFTENTSTKGAHHGSGGNSNALETITEDSHNS